MKVGLVDLLALMFIGLKLGGAIDWSWWWVVSPWLIVTGLLALIGIYKVHTT